MYNVGMKFLAIMLVLLIAAPLPQVFAACDMPAEQAAEVTSNTPESDDDGHDCCADEDPAQPEDDDCSDASHCSACYAGSCALPVFLDQFVASPDGAAFAPPAVPAEPSHDLPPYRPPIA